MTETNAQASTSFRWLKQVLPWLLLLVFVLAVEYWIGWWQILQPWQQFSWWQLLAGIVLILLSYGLRTLRIYDYFIEKMRGYGWTSLRLMLIHNVLNNLLPARSGELSFPLLMRRDFGVDYAESVAALVWFRLLDLHTILTFAIYPLLVLTPLRRFWLPFMLLWLLLPPLFYWWRASWVEGLVQGEGRVRSLLQKALPGLPDNATQFWKSWALTWVNWLVKLLTLAWVLAQFVDRASWNVLIGAVVGGELTSVLPLHAPGGVGTYEAGIIAALTAFMPMAVATAAAINVHLFVLGSSLLGGVIGWLIPRRQWAGTHGGSMRVE